jgi:molybdopterin-guanine dinucleotide biosynthesis adapter protein
MYKLGIVGAKNSGKTTLIENILALLSEKGVSAMSVKHTSHQHAFDSTGKDSDRHRKAGAKLTMAINPNEFAIFSENNERLQYDIENTISHLFDICIIEGDKYSNIPKILLTRNIESINSKEIENIIAAYGDISYSEDVQQFNTAEISQVCNFIIELALSKIIPGGCSD